MKSREKKGLLILILVALVIIGIIWFATRPKENGQAQNGKTTQGESVGEFTVKQSDGTIVNTSEKLKQNKEIQGFKISNIQFKEQGGESELVADVTNTTTEAKPGFLVDIVLYDKNGAEIGRIPANIIETEAGETIQIHAGITESYTNAYDFKMEEKQ